MASQQKYRRSPGARPPSGKRAELTIQRGAYGGRMVAREDAGRVVLVQGGLVTETVRAELTLEKKNFAEARAVTILHKATGRATPPCGYFGENGHTRGSLPEANELPGERGACGGCQYQHMEYEMQLELKRSIVSDLVHRQGRMPDLDVLPTIASPSPWQYRNRARWIMDENGIPSYHQAATDRLMSVSMCHIVQPRIAETLQHLSNEGWRLPFRTLVAEITARTAQPWREGDDETVSPSVLLALHPRPGAKRRDLRLVANDLGSMLPAVDGVVLGVAPGERLEGNKSLWGSSYFDAHFAGYRYRLAPLTFFQVNEPAAELLVAQVLAALGNLGGKNVLDVYAGAGTFTIPIATHANQVLALENDPLAVADAHASVKANGLTNVHLMPGDAEEELTGLPRNAVDLAVVDPPRAGLSEEVKRELVRLEVPRIVYVSCDPATLVRDLQHLAGEGYIIESVQPLDLFPQTFHVETIATLTRL